MANGTKLLIIEEHLAHNISLYKEVGSRDTILMGMVKANAYGMGLELVARLMLKHGVSWLGIAQVDEGIELRNAGINAPIFVANPSFELLDELIEYKLSPAISSLALFEAIADRFKTHHSEKGQLNIHVKINSGMNRMGLNPALIPELAALVKQNPEIHVDSVFTHLSSADDEEQDEFTHQQIRVFNAAVDSLTNLLGYRPKVHTNNSAAAIRFPKHNEDIMRLGIGLYGYGIHPKQKGVGILKTHIIQIQAVEAGEPVGYNRTEEAPSKGYVAIIPIGYADGFRRSLGNGRWHVWIGGRRYPTIGRVSMDLTTIFLGEDSYVVGEEVFIFKTCDEVMQMADVLETIPYEIFTLLGNRVDRKLL